MSLRRQSGFSIVELLVSMLQAGTEQYRLITAERELLTGHSHAREICRFNAIPNVEISYPDIRPFLTQSGYPIQ